MPLLLNQIQAAREAGISVPKFRAICKAGKGPRVFNPLDGGRPMYAIAAVTEWANQRSDPQPLERAS